MADKITYTEKEQGQVSTEPVNKRWNFGDANEVKSVINSHADDIDDNTSDLGTIDNLGVLKQDIEKGGNIVYVQNVSDFPDAVSGVITLSDADTVYQIIGNVDIDTDRIVVDAQNIKFQGSYAAGDSLVSSVSGQPMISGVNVGINCEKITLKGANSTYIINLTDDGTHNVTIQNVSIDGADTVLSVSNCAALVVARPALWTNFNNGIVLSGTIPSGLISQTLFSSFTGTAIDLNGVNLLSFDIGENAAYLDSGSTFLSISPDGGNILAGGAGSIRVNKVIELASSTAITGYDSLESGWTVLFNTSNIIPSDRLDPNGWAFYSDDVSSTQVFTGTPSQLSINALGSTTEESKLPLSIRGLSSLWDDTTDCITPITSGDTYDLRIILEITNTASNPTRFSISLDIGDTPDGTGGAGSIIIAEDSKTLKTGTPQTHVISFPIFTLDTFLANCGTLWVTVDSGSITVSERSILIVRTGSGAN